MAEGYVCDPSSQLLSGEGRAVAVCRYSLKRFFLTLGQVDDSREVTRVREAVQTLLGHTSDA
jgi:hypothetical protein